MAATLSPDTLATDLAEYLVRKGVPFRDTHHISGQVFALAENNGRPIDQLSVKELQTVDTPFGEDVKTVFGYQRSVEQRTAFGGCSEESVLQKIEVLNNSQKSFTT
jgi:argininosuccinate lyase